MNRKVWSQWGSVAVGCLALSTVFGALAAGEPQKAKGKAQTTAATNPATSTVAAASKPTTVVKATANVAAAAQKPPSLSQQLTVRAVNPTLAPPTRAGKQSVEHKFEVKQTSGTRRFEVKLSASGWVDRRVLEYLEKTLRVIAVKPSQANEAAAFRDAKAQPDSHRDEISVALRALDGADVSQYTWLPPDGFELVRPGVLGVEKSFVTALSKNKKKLDSGADGVGGATAALTGNFTQLRGKILCRAAGLRAPSPLPFISLEIDGHRITTLADGTFSTDGSFGTGRYTVRVIYDSVVRTGSVTTPLVVMDDVHQPRSEVVKPNSTGTSGTAVLLGDVVLTSVDCELHRLGAAALIDYHDTVSESPPAGKLRLKRWSGVWDGTPHTYYDYIVLTTNFSQVAPYNDESSRRRTLFHEFGHSIRHVADGDELHWGWDNFRWAYARSHNRCEVFNTQYAFNEGWANYWGARSGVSIPNCPSLGQDFLDWNETLIAGHLQKLSNALCSSSNGRECARKMISVLQPNPGAIHSIRDFEVRYCQLYSAGNTNCRGVGVPDRKAPLACPPGFHDDGATCRFENIVTKPSYGRGVGKVPSVCDAGSELDAGLCYPQCRAGFDGVGPVCWQDCPSSYRDDGAFCAKPEAYGRGAGYAWQFGDGLNLNDAVARCERDHGRGQCEQNGLIIYPKCRSGFHAVGCCVCSPNCPAGMSDIGVSCAKQSYGRGAGKVPNRCSGGMQYDAGLCYTPCRTGFNGVGPVCWGSCPAGFADHGATCYADPNILVKY